MCTCLFLKSMVHHSRGCRSLINYYRYSSFYHISCAGLAGPADKPATCETPRLFIARVLGSCYAIVDCGKRSRTGPRRTHAHAPWHSATGPSRLTLEEIGQSKYECNGMTQVPCHHPSGFVFDGYRSSMSGDSTCCLHGYYYCRRVQSARRVTWQPAEPTPPPVGVPALTAPCLAPAPWPELQHGGPAVAVHQTLHLCRCCCGRCCFRWAFWCVASGTRPGGPHLP